MRYTSSKALVLGLLSTWILCSDGNVIGRDPAANGLSIRADFGLSRRAGGGGGGGGKGGGKGGNHENSGGPDGTSGSGAGEQNGDKGGFDNTNSENEGGFSKTCDKKRSWPLTLFWRRTGCAGDAPIVGPGSGPGSAGTDNPGPLFPPSVRNNYNKPATSETRTYNPENDIDIAAKTQEFKNIIKEKNLQDGLWYFYSGFEDKQKRFDVQEDLEKRLHKKLPYIEDAMPVRGADKVRNAFKGTTNEQYFWAAYSKAYAQAISGKIIIALPEDQPINMPKDNKDGTVWWSFEAPALTRNPDVTEISYVAVGGLNLDLDGGRWEMAPEKVIWKKGDEPLGFPGDPHYMETKPTEAWNPDS